MRAGHEVIATALAMLTVDEAIEDAAPCELTVTAFDFKHSGGVALALTSPDGQLGVIVAWLPVWEAEKLRDGLITAVAAQKAKAS